MSNEAGLTAQEQEVESLLEQFHPWREGRVRDQLMFQAGRRSAGHVRLWQGISGVFALLFVCSLILPIDLPCNAVPIAPSPFVAQSQSPMIEESMRLDNRPMDEEAYIRIRSRVLAHGLDALPKRTRGQTMGNESLKYGDALRRLKTL